MKEELLKTHNEVSEIGSLHSSAYERIFNVYKDQGEFYAYNIIKTVQFPADMDDEYFTYIKTIGRDPCTKLSFDFYGDIRLWWLICLVNKIMNPVVLPDPGTTLKILKPEFINTVLDQIEAQV